MPSSMSIAGRSLKFMSVAWFSGSKSVKSTKFLSSMFFSMVDFSAGGVKGFRKAAPGLRLMFVPFVVECS